MWRSGVVLTNGSARAEVREFYFQRVIQIRVSGLRQRDLLLPVAHELDKIHASYDRLEFQKLIPCNCDRCGGNPDPEFYPLDVLQQFWRDRQLEIQCRKSYKPVNVRQLIDDVTDELRYPDLSFQGNDRFQAQKRQPSGAMSPPQQNINVTIQTSQEHQTVSNQPQFQGDYVRGDKVMGDKVGRDKIGTQINNASPNVLETVRLIKALLAELSEEYNPNTQKGQNLIQQEALQRLEQDPTLRQRLLNALKEGGSTAIEEMIDHPVVKPLMAAAKGWLDA